MLGDAKRIRNIRILYFYSFLSGLEFYLPIYALYLEQELLTLLNVALIISLIGVANVIFEVPTGMIADNIGRKKTLVLSSTSSLISITFLLLGGNFIVIAFSAIFSGLSQSLSSGTVTSLAFESTENEIENISIPRFKRVNAILHSLWPIGASISSIIGGFLALTNLKIPILYTLFPFSLALFSLFYLTETKIVDTKIHSTSLVDKTKTSFQLVFSNKQISILIGVGFLSYIGEVVHKLKPVYFEFKGISLQYFGFLFAMTFALSFVGSILSDPISDRLGNKKTLIISSLLPIAFQLISVITTEIFSGLILVFGSLTWGIKWPIVSEMLNKELDENNRTTILSIANLAKMLSLGIFAPIFGYIGDLTSINTLYLLDAILFFFILLPYFSLKDY